MEFNKKNEVLGLRSSSRDLSPSCRVLAGMGIDLGVAGIAQWGWGGTKGGTGGGRVLGAVRHERAPQDSRRARDAPRWAGGGADMRGLLVQEHEAPGRTPGGCRGWGRGTVPHLGLGTRVSPCIGRARSALCTPRVCELLLGTALSPPVSLSR